MADEFDDRNLRGTLNAWRESAEQQAQREEWFWARQRARIEARASQPRVRRMPMLAWAGIAATVAVGVALVIPGDNKGPATGRVPAKATPQITAKAELSDHDLMQDLEETMNSGVPDALQPASTLEQEMEQAYSAKTTKESK